MECPDRLEMEGLLAGRLPREQQEALERHVGLCSRCQQYLEESSGLGQVRPDGAAPQCLRPAPSGALRRVIDDLSDSYWSLVLPVGADAEARGDAPFPLSFLQPTDRPGFLGRLGVYEIRREIARGGMGIVFEGLDPALARVVAIKVISPLGAGASRERFLREARAAAALEHEHVVTIHAVDQVNGMPFLVMQYIAGESLAGRLAREHALPFAEVVRIGAQVARGLAAAHAKGLVHRDIKPANILLEAPTGRVKIADFGLAKAAGDGALTDAEIVVGTPEFMSPEQTTVGDERPTVDGRSDLFSLGTVLYLAASGVSPFRDESPLLALDRVRSEQPVPLKELVPAVPGWLSALLQKLMMKDPADRIPSARELAELLERAVEVPTDALSDVRSATVALRTPARRNQLRTGGIALAGLVVLAGATGVYFSWPARTHPEQSRDGPAHPELPPERSHEPGFFIEGQPTKYPDLDRAVAAAPNDAVIVVTGDGPFRTPPVRVAGKRLTIRAAAGSRPIICALDPDTPQAGPLLRTDADLQLEGLELRWSIVAPKGPSVQQILEHCVVVSTGGRLALVHCQVTLDRTNSAVGASGQGLVLKNCYFPRSEGVAVFWRPEAGAQVRVEGCQIETFTGLMVYTHAPTADRTPATVLLAGNTFTSTEVVRLLLNLERKQPVKFTARRNIFDNESLMALYMSANLKKVELLRPNQMSDLLRSFVAWSDDTNLYRRGCQYLSSVTQGPGRSVGIGDMAEWSKLWNRPRTDSVEGIIRYHERGASPQSAPLRLKQVEEQSGPVPPEVGADPDKLGPGPAYHSSLAGRK